MGAVGDAIGSIFGGGSQKAAPVSKPPKPVTSAAARDDARTSLFKLGALKSSKDLSEASTKARRDRAVPNKRSVDVLGA